MRGPSPCPIHLDRPAETACQSCAIPMCPECWRRSVDGAPWCEGCVALLEKPTPPVAYLAFVTVAVGVCGLAIRAVRIELLPEVRWGVFAAVAIPIAIATFVLYRRASKSRLARVVTERPEAPPFAAQSYRGHARRIGRRLAPPLSGRMATVVVASMLATVAAVVPSVLALPRWIEGELVVGIWYLVWTATFSALLFRGWRLAHDTGKRAPMAEDPKAAKKRSGFWSWGDIGDLGAVDGEGCLVLLALLAAVGLIILASWLLIELVVPAIALVVYWLVLRGLARVANDSHGCEGNALLSVGWGALWAALYTAPLGLLVAAVHFLLALRGG